MEIRNFNIFAFLSSRKLALVLLILILSFSLFGAILPSPLANQIIFSSLWFNFLLVLLTVNILFCTLNRITNLYKSIREHSRILNSRLFVMLGSIIFHFSFVLLLISVVYDNLFFFEGGIRLTEGESLSCAQAESYDWVRMGRFFKISKLKDLGEIYFHKLYPFYYVKNDYKGVANKIVLHTESNKKEGIIHVNRPLKYKGFEFYRDADGLSPLFVFRDRWGRVLDGAYAPLHGVKRKDGSFVYMGGFPLPRDNPIFGLWTVFFPATKERGIKIFLEIYEGEKEIFKGTIAPKEIVPVGIYSISTDELRWWSRMKVIYRPGLFLIFFSFWLAFGGISLSTVAKMVKRDR